MRWYWWVLIAILGLNLVAMAMLGFMMVGDWIAHRRSGKHEGPPPADERGSRAGPAGGEASGWSGTWRS